jgi:hypothetical protein
MSEYRNTRPDSPKGQVYAAFKEGGFVAACKRAEELGIAASRVNGWLKDNGNGFQDINERRKETAEGDEPAPLHSTEDHTETYSPGFADRATAKPGDFHLLDPKTGKWTRLW